MNRFEMIAAQLTARGMVASTSRYCFMYKADNGKWYFELTDREYDYERRNATTYGPFSSESEAEKGLEHFSNPGALDVDDSGEEEAPVRSPNGRPIEKPRRGMYGSIRVADSKASLVRVRRPDMLMIRFMPGTPDYNRWDSECMRLYQEFSMEWERAWAIVFPGKDSQLKVMRLPAELNTAYGVRLEMYIGINAEVWEAGVVEGKQFRKLMKMAGYNVDKF